MFRDNQSPPASSSQVFIGKKELLESTPGFVSVIVYNNNQFKSLCASDPKSVNEGIGTLYMHTWLLQLLGCALRETEDKKPQAVAQNKNPQVPAHKTGKQAAPVRLSDVLVVETRSATHIKDANRQLLFMFDTLKIHILNVKFSLLGKYFGRENLPMFFRQLASRYFRAVFNIILARKFRKAGFDMPIAKHLVASHPFAFPLLLLPYAAITLLPVLFSRATYVLFKNLLLIIHATTEYEVHLSESRWKP
ncbi:hypothetical protein FJZ26_03340 [Candidatus Parvarchaeota archaeon]|nr:hypothetical protein [Candidatus Parvarchaeota archaeon]